MIISGLARLGRDAEVRFLQDGTPVANLAIAYNYGQKDNAGKRPTQWVDASLWGKRAEGAAPYLLKGTLINVVCDDVHVHTFTRQNGEAGSSIKARVMSFEFAGGNKKDENGQTQSRPAATTTTKPAQSPGNRGGNFENLDDDIPF